MDNLSHEITKLNERITNLSESIDKMGDKEKVIVGKRFKISMRDCLKELKEYKELEKQGLLLRLPCKIGDIVYSVTRNFISEYTICSIEKYNEDFFFNWRCEKGIYINIRGFTDYDIGKTVFLTKEEAKQALKQMGEVE